MMPWMAWLRKYIGQHEVSGWLKNNQFIVALFKHTSYVADSDETPWCAACACSALEETGYLSPHRADAISFKNYGDPCDLKPGCIVVMTHPKGGHHVTFCVRVIDDNFFAALGGNQSNELKVSTYSRSEITATRWPIQKLSAA